jgi:hypothetical protein
MVGRRLRDESDLLLAGFGYPDFIRRRSVLRETLDAYSSATPPERYQLLAAANLERWHKGAPVSIPKGQVKVIAGDWGEVTHSLTRAYGSCFAVLNMANAYVPGGAYVEGAPAQEENMFRRTDCHFYVDEHEYDEATDSYSPEMTRLLSAADGRVYLDVERPRTCIRGREDRDRDDLGYEWLAEEEIFPFFELRASALDLRDGTRFDAAEASRRIVAQLETLQEHEVRHAVLGAIGCGAFENPATEVARIYRDEIETRRRDFSLLAFAIYSAGYGPDNYEPFAAVFAGLGQ